MEEKKTDGLVDSPANTNLSIIDGINVSLVQQTMQKIASFQAVVKNTLKDGHDYGVIPGTGAKPTLLKPGAEKILMLLGLTSEYELIEKITDYKKGFFAFTVKCIVYRNDQKITEGVGHANTRERRYTSGKVQGAYTLANTVLKMAKKRAQVDAVLTVASLSEIFTQDLEDGIEVDPPPPTSYQGQGAEGAATDLQLKKIAAMAKELNLDEKALDDIIQRRYGKGSRKDLTKAEASNLIGYLQGS